MREDSGAAGRRSSGLNPAGRKRWVFRVSRDEQLDGGSKHATDPATENPNSVRVFMPAAFEFEQASIYSTEAIEISKTTTASMDADAPAGRINLCSKNAFDRKGREITAQLALTGNTYAMTLKKTPG